MAKAEFSAGDFITRWFVALALNGYWFLLREAYRMDLHERALRWWSPLRSGRIPLDRLHEIRPAPFGPSAMAFEVGGGPDIPVQANRRFAAFAEQVQAAAPRINVRLIWYLRMAGRFGRSG